MNPAFLKVLSDPATGEELELRAERSQDGNVIEGSLVSHSNCYPIVRGVPRFAGYGTEGYVSSFSYQWNKWSRVQFESDNAGGPMEGHTLRMWERITGIEDSDLGEQLVADFGCGPGRFIDIARRKKARVIGIDLSAAVEAAAENFADDPNVLICQADVLRPPLKPGSLDGAFSVGVLHHTPDPGRGCMRMAETVRAGGWVALSVYGKGGYYDFPTVRLYRRVSRMLWPVFRHYPALTYSYVAAYALRPLSRVPVLGLLVRAGFPVVPLPDARWSLLDTFDSITPQHQSAHESYEVFQWFKGAGLEHIEPSDWGFTAWHARKPGTRS